MFERRLFVFASERLEARLRDAVSWRPSLGIISVPEWLLDRSHLASSEISRLFSSVAQQIDRIPPRDLRNTTILVPALCRFDEPARWNALLERKGGATSSPAAGVFREVLFARLVLTFPEVAWLFWMDGNCDGRLNRVETWHGVAPGLIPDPSDYDEDGRSTMQGCVAGGLTGLFDPGGLRSMVRGALSQRGEGGTESPSPSSLKRERVAACIDEEEPYAYFGSYVCYRFGHRAWPVASWRLMKRLFQRKMDTGDYKAPEGVELSLTLEDLYLSFPDRDPVDRGHVLHLSDLKDRDAVCPALKLASYRVFVTVGHHRGRGNSATWKADIDYLRKSRIPFRLLFKPLGGLFSLARGVGLRKLDGKISTDRRRASRRAVRGDEVGRRHSAEGQLLTISEHLLRRSRSLLASETTIQDAIHAATLALEASELLGGRTPTTALEALSLQHEAEVVAESLFLGIDQNLDLKERFKEIETQVKSICRWFHPRTQRRSELNARLAIIERLGRRFSDLHEIEEELDCLAEARRLRFKFWARQKWWRRPLGPVLDYLSFCLASLPRFIMVVGCWALFFGFSYYLFAQLVPGRPNDLLNAMAAASKLFFTGEPATNWASLGGGASHGLETMWDFWLTFQGTISFTNLGLLVSHLYLIVSRR